MPKVTTSKRVGNIITQNTTKTKTRKNLMGGTTTKSVKAKIVTDLDAQKTDATGTKTKVVTNRKGEQVKMKTKKLSPRKVITKY